MTPSALRRAVSLALGLLPKNLNQRASWGIRSSIFDDAQPFSLLFRFGCGFAYSGHVEEPPVPQFIRNDSFAHEGENLTVSMSRYPACQRPIVVLKAVIIKGEPLREISEIIYLCH